MTLTFNIDVARRLLSVAAVLAFWTALVLAVTDVAPTLTAALWVTFAVVALLGLSVWLVAETKPSNRTDPAAVEDADTWGFALLAWLERIGPRQGWRVFALLLASLGVVTWSVVEAHWVLTPGLWLIMLGSAVVGMALAHARRHAAFLLPLGLAFGGVVVYWQTTRLVTDVDGIDRVRQTWTRLSAWYEAASSGGLSNDLLPFTLGLLAFAWVVGFLSAWFLFRRDNVWMAVILTSVSLLTNLSFLPDSFQFRFFLFMFLIMLLIVSVSINQRKEQWVRSSVQVGEDSNKLGLSTSVALVVVVLVVAASVPLYVYSNRTATRIYLAGRSPVASVEDGFIRLFAGLPSRKDVSGRFWGSTLPFHGQIGFEGDIVMWATAEQSSYWLAQTYSKYTSKGWFAGETRKVKVGPKSGPPPPQETGQRVPITQVVDLDFDTLNVLASGNVQWISKEAVVETLAPKQFEFKLSDPGALEGMPADVRAIGADIRAAIGQIDPRFVEAQVSQILPSDLVLLDTTIETNPNSPSGLDLKVRLVRKEPLTQDVTAWKFDDQLSKDESYAMGSLISSATNDNLRAADTRYSGFISDHYLELPDSLPQRVVDVAQSVTRDAETPFEKALALQEFLRGEQFNYNQKIDAPPRDADGVDHFLFETKEGYSDYFASSMAVMLRAVGVPSRLAAGYAPGVLDEESRRWAIRDSDSHGWTQAYFPGYGWIDFEPTAKWPATRGLESGLGSTTQEEAEPRVIADQEDISDPLVQCSELESLIAQAECLDDLALGQTRDAPDGSTNLFETLRGPLTWLVIALVSIVGFWTVVRLAWNAGLGKASQSERLYTKMGRLGLLAGIRRRAQQTPFEYAASLGDRIPRAADGAGDIARAFAADRYGNVAPDEDLDEMLADSWKSIRSPLLARSLKRVVLLGGG